MHLNTKTDRDGAKKKEKIDEEGIHIFFAVLHIFFILLYYPILPAPLFCEFKCTQKTVIMYTITFLGEVIKTSHFLDLFLCVQVYTKACHYVHNNISRRGDQDVPLRTARGRQLR